MNAHHPAQLLQRASELNTTTSEAVKQKLLDRASKSEADVKQAEKEKHEMEDERRKKEVENTKSGP